KQMAFQFAEPPRLPFCGDTANAIVVSRCAPQTQSRRGSEKWMHQQATGVNIHRLRCQMMWPTRGLRNRELVPTHFEPGGCPLRRFGGEVAQRQDAFGRRGRQLPPAWQVADDLPSWTEWWHGKLATMHHHTIV